MPFQFRKEAIEEDLNSNFPSQGQGNPPLYYSLSEVVVPTYNINNVAEGTSLPENLQTAWDFSTGASAVNAATVNLVTTPGFWQVDLNFIMSNAAGADAGFIEITDGVSVKQVWGLNDTASNQNNYVTSDKFVVFLRSGDTLRGRSTTGNVIIDVWYRQIADVNGNLVNPLGFSFA